MSQRPYKDFYVATTGTLLASGTTTDLAVGQLGLFNAKTWQATTAPTIGNGVKKLVIAQGTPDLSGMPEGAGIPNVSFKVEIDSQKGKVIDWYVKKAARPQNMIVTVGFDGVDTTKNLTANYGETKQLYLKLSGQPISKFYPDVNAGLKIPLFINIPDCSGDCADGCGTAVPGDLIADEIIKRVQEQKIIGGQELDRYVKATKLISCTTPSGYPTVAYEKYCLTILDDGSPKALGIVQAQYPGLVIKRTLRNGVYSTYEFVQIATEPAPAAFDNSSITVVPNCSECPSGYTLQDLLYVYKVTLTDNGDGTALTTFRASYGSTAIRLNYEFGTSTYFAFSPTAIPTWTPITGAVQLFVGEQSAVCVGGIGVTTAWTLCDTGTKAEKLYQLSLKNDPCGVTKLEELQDLYAEIGTVTLVENNTTFCTSLFQIVVDSTNTLFSDCGDEVYDFKPPFPYTNQPWIPVVQDVTGVDCVYGVRFEAAYFDVQKNACTFEVPYFNDPIYIELGEHDPSSLGSPCETDWAITTVQAIKFPSGFGQFVSDEEKLSKYYRNVFYNVDPLVRKYRGYDWNTDFEGYYDEYVLVFDSRVDEYGVNSAFRTETFEVHFYLPETEGTEFQNAINGWLASANINLDLKVL